jgi:hypothetical protein
MFALTFALGPLASHSIPRAQDLAGSSPGRWGLPLLLLHQGERQPVALKSQEEMVRHDEEREFGNYFDVYFGFVFLESPKTNTPVEIVTALRTLLN